MKLSALIWLGLVMVLHTGCKVTQPVLHTVHRTDSVIERERLVPITVAATSVETRLSPSQLDSLKAALRNLPVGNRTIYYTDPKFKTQLIFALDSIGQLVIQCKTLEALYWEKLKEKDRIIEIKDFEIREQSKTFWQKLQQFIDHGMWFLVLLIIAFIIVAVTSKLKNR
jgi:hypothetical protein